MPTNDDADDDEKGQKAKYYSHKYLGKKQEKVSSRAIKNEFTLIVKRKRVCDACVLMNFHSNVLYVRA